MAEPQKLLRELASKLENPPASEDALVNLLKQGATCLSEIAQSPPRPIMESILPFQNAIAKQGLMKHHDAEVRLFLAACHCEITRITAPEAPYDDEVFKDVFELIVGTFSGLSDTNNPLFARRVGILETLAKYRSCVVMLDLECDDLISEMFNTLFQVARDDHSENVSTAMQLIMECVIDESEDVEENLLMILLSILSRKEEDLTKAARKLAISVILRCAGKLEPSIKQFLVKSMSEKESKSLAPGIDYHRVIYNIYCRAPQILSGVVPYLAEELLRDELNIRLKAVALIGDLLSYPGFTISELFQPVFKEFLKRLTDRVTEVRMSVLQHVKRCLLMNPSRAEAPQIIDALRDRLMDYDENVRKLVVSVICDVTCHTLTSIPVDTVKMVADRLRDKSLLVKEYTMDRLADIYRTSCTTGSSSSSRNNGYDWIVGKILRCFYDKDFKSDAIESTLSLSLFPTDFSAKDKATYWVMIFAGFDKIEVKALEKILEQKQRLQLEMQKYLSLRHLPQEGDGAGIQKKAIFHFRVMSRCFTDPAKTEDNFLALDQLKDANIWKNLARLVDPNTSFLGAKSSRDDMMRILGLKHPLYDFLRVLSLKCSYLLFDKEHVKEILVEAGLQKSSGNNELILSCMTILVILARFSPLLLGGIEEDLVHLLEDDNEIIKEGTLHILAKAGGTIREQLGVSSRSLDLILERICIEGSRRQAKYAVHALASITKDDGLMSLSVLYKRLVDMLEEKSHLPAVLQSLGCIAQAAMPVFETRESEVEKFIKENILKHGHIKGENATDCWDDRSELCSLKIFGVKALVKSYLPVKDAQLRSGIDELIEILKNILSFGDISKEIRSSSVDRAHLKLAASKAVLRLSKHWEHKIPADVFYLTLRTSEDNFPEVRKLLLNKIHQYVKDRILDPKYACAFLLDISSEQSDLEENKHNLNDIIQMCRQGKARQISLQADAHSLAVYPEYILPYVVHSLAHHPSFPNIDEGQDVKAFEAMYRQLYFFLSMLLHGDADGKSDITISKDMETIALLSTIFRCIKRSEDAFGTGASKNLYAMCDLGMSIIKRLAPKRNDLQDPSSSVTLPPALYTPLMKSEDNEVAEEKTWLADEAVLAHFESLKLETNGLVSVVIAEDDAMKDSETESAEMPLGKLMKLLKAKAAKARREVKTEAKPAAGGPSENNFDILKMVEEINSDNLGTVSKFESSNGHGPIQKKKRSDHKLKKREHLFSGSTEVPVPKRRRTSSAQAKKSPGAIVSNSSKKPANVDDESNRMEEDLQSSSEGRSLQENTTVPAKTDVLVSSTKKKSSSSTKHKGRSSDMDFDDDLPPAIKKSKKVSEKGSPLVASSSKLGSSNKKQNSDPGLKKCTTKDGGKDDLIDCRIKVWWPMDKMYYYGVIKSYDTKKNKHVILYDDNEVEVLRLDNEKWELSDADGEEAPKKSGSSKGAHSKGGSSSQKKKSTGITDLEEKSTTKKKEPTGDTSLEEKSSSKKKVTDAISLEEKLSQVRGKRTPRKKSSQPKKKVVKKKASSESDESSDVIPPDLTIKSTIDESGSDKQKKKSEKTSKTAAEDDRDDSEATETDDVGGSEKDKSDNEVSSGDEKLVKDTHMEDVDADKPDKSDKKASDSGDDMLSDNETLVSWKQRVAKK